jgi:hypothetical protein
LDSDVFLERGDSQLVVVRDRFDEQANLSDRFDSVGNLVEPLTVMRHYLSEPFDAIVTGFVKDA